MEAVIPDDQRFILFGENMSIAEQAVNLALQSMARRIDTLKGETLPSRKNPGNNTVWEHEILGTSVVVFNPHTWSVRMPVQINVVADRMTDETGREIPFQTVRGDQTDWESFLRGRSSLQPHIMRLKPFLQTGERRI